MLNEVLRELLSQQQMTNAFTLERINEENTGYRLNPQAASVGFIHRHLAETLNRFGNVLGVPTNVQNATIGLQDEGQDFDLATSGELRADGYAMLETVIEHTTEEEWLQPVDTPFFGGVSRARMFAHALYHTAHHIGQISPTLARASE